MLEVETVCQIANIRKTVSCVTANVVINLIVTVARFLIPVVFYEITNVQGVYWSDNYIYW